PTQVFTVPTWLATPACLLTKCAVALLSLAWTSALGSYVSGFATFVFVAFPVVAEPEPASGTAMAMRTVAASAAMKPLRMQPPLCLPRRATGAPPARGRSGAEPERADGVLCGLPPWKPAQAITDAGSRGKRVCPGSCSRPIRVRRGCRALRGG